jgi:hypothetical protein
MSALVPLHRVVVSYSSSSSTAQNRRGSPRHGGGGGGGIARRTALMATRRGSAAASEWGGAVTATATVVCRAAAPDAPPPLTPRATADLRDEAVAWAAQHGLLIGTGSSEAGAPITASFTHAPIAVLPTPFPRDVFELALEVSPLFAALSDAVSRDDAFLRSTLAGVILTDDFTERIWRIYEACGGLALFHHIILHSKHQLMTAGIVHVTNLTPGSDNPSVRRPGGEAPHGAGHPPQRLHAGRALGAAAAGGGQHGVHVLHGGVHQLLNNSQYGPRNQSPTPGSECNPTVVGRMVKSTSDDS